MSTATGRLATFDLIAACAIFMLGTAAVSIPLWVIAEAVLRIAIALEASS